VSSFSDVHRSGRPRVVPLALSHCPATRLLAVWLKSARSRVGGRRHPVQFGGRVRPGVGTRCAPSVWCDHAGRSGIIWARDRPVRSPLDSDFPSFAMMYRGPCRTQHSCPWGVFLRLRQCRPESRLLITLLTIGYWNNAPRHFRAAQAGSSKTDLALRSLARHVEADVCVLGLVGERGREARNFGNRSLSDSTP